MNQVVWVKVKGHTIWPGTILEQPDFGNQSRPRYKCNFFNSNDIAFVPENGLFDFVTKYH